MLRHKPSSAARSEDDFKTGPPWKQMKGMKKMKRMKTTYGFILRGHPASGARDPLIPVIGDLDAGATMKP
jgi:hypothetical protein